MSELKINITKMKIMRFQIIYLIFLCIITPLLSYFEIFYIPPICYMLFIFAFIIQDMCIEKILNKE